jgi:tetratricopeptide (TPR) repeat protein
MVFCAWGLCYAQNATAHYFERSDTLFIRQNEILKEAKAKGDLLKEARALQRMGQICYQMGLFTQGLDYHIKADEIYRSDKNEHQMAVNLNDLGLLFLITKQENDARQSFFKALEIFRRLDDLKATALTYAHIGHFYEKIVDYDSANFYQHKALQIFERMGDAEGVALVHENLGSIYEDKMQLDEAHVHFSKALSWFEQGSNTEMRIDVYNNLGDVYRKKGAYKHALYYTRKAEALSKRTNSHSRLSSAYRDLGKTYNFLRKSDSTFHYLELSREYFLKSYSEESKNQEALLKVIYGLDRKEIQLAEMERQEKVAWAIYLVSGIVALLFIVVAVIIIRNQRLRMQRESAVSRREEALLKTQQELLEIDLSNKKLQEEQLKESLHNKAREITVHTLQSIQKNQLLEGIGASLKEMIKSDGRSYKKELRSLLNRINQNFNKDNYWDDFRRIYEEINQDFFDKLQEINPGLSATEIKFISLIKLNMDSKDIAALLGVSSDSLRVSRYRLRKKLNLTQGSSLTAFIQSI